MGLTYQIKSNLRQIEEDLTETPLPCIVAGQTVGTELIYLAEIDVITEADGVDLVEKVGNESLRLYKGDLEITDLAVAQLAMYGYVNGVLVGTSDANLLLDDVSAKLRVKAMGEIAPDAIKEELLYVERGERGKRYYQAQRRTLRLSRNNATISEADGDAIYNYTEGAKLALLGEDIITARKKIQTAITTATADGASATILSVLGTFESDLIAMETELY